MAELNPNIILGIQGPQIQPYDASQGLIKGLTLKNLIQQGKAGEMQAKVAEQAYNDDMGMREAYKTAGGNPEAVRAELVNRGLYLQVNEFDKNALEKREKTVNIDKALSGISKDKLEGDIKKLDVIRNVGMGPLNAYKAAIAKGVSPEMAMQAIQPMWEAAVTGLKNTGMFDEKFLSTVPAQFDPNRIEADLAQTLKYSDFLNNEIQRRGQDITVRGQDISQATAIRGQNVSAATAKRGQDMVDARAKDKLEFDRGQGKAPSGYRFNSSGALEPIKGGPADKSVASNLTEQQGKASLFSSRAEEADKIIKGLEGKYSPLAIAAKTAAGKVPVFGGGAEMSANALLSDESQKAEQAQRDFINAILRQESGAVIAETEFDNARKQYFPQPGDSKAVIEQKAKNRTTAINGLRKMAGPGASKQGASGDWSIVEVP
jgi:hypothetical protein